MRRRKRSRRWKKEEQEERGGILDKKCQQFLTLGTPLMWRSSSTQQECVRRENIVAWVMSLSFLPNPDVGICSQLLRCLLKDSEGHRAMLGDCTLTTR